MNEDVLRIIQAAAMGILCEDCEDGYSCPYCPARAGFSDRMRQDVPELNELMHDADCPVTLARRLLVENGTPMGIYQIKCEQRLIRRGPWYETSGYTLAISEQESIRNYSNATTRNVTATFVRLFPVEAQ